MKWIVRAAGKADLAEWLRMRCLLWPEGSEQEHQAEAEEWLGLEGAVALVAEREGGGLCGFAEVGTRSVADGCETSPVAYLEGWWVDDDVRRMGIGKALVLAAERWARERGLSEMGSDSLIDNHVSQEAHTALGFSEVDRVVLYTKKLD